MSPICSKISTLIMLALITFAGQAPVEAQEVDDPAQDPFAEPDSIPRFALGPIIELTFRGSLGKLADGTTIDLSNGPAFGARVEFRLSRTGTFVLRGSYARTEEKVELSGGGEVFGAKLTEIEGAAELLLKLKPTVPGYFIVGAGARYVDPDAVDPGDPTTARFTKEESSTEPLATAGLGLELGNRRRGAFRIEGRLYFAVPTSQEFDTKGVVTDFALGLSYVFRF